MQANEMSYAMYRCAKCHGLMITDAMAPQQAGNYFAFQQPSVMAVGPINRFVFHDCGDECMGLAEFAGIIPVTKWEAIKAELLKRQAQGTPPVAGNPPTGIAGMN